MGLVKFVLLCNTGICFPECIGALQKHTWGLAVFFILLFVMNLIALYVASQQPKTAVKLTFREVIKHGVGVPGQK